MNEMEEEIYDKECCKSYGMHINDVPTYIQDKIKESIVVRGEKNGKNDRSRPRRIKGIHRKVV
jgi:hypothetical protein